MAQKRLAVLGGTEAVVPLISIFDPNSYSTFQPLTSIAAFAVPSSLAR